MPGVSRASAQVEDHGPVEDRHADLDGYTVNFVTFREDIDGAPMLKGLPNDRCHCAHWGYVFKRRVTYRFGDRDEVFEAGDAFYVEPGHTPLVAVGTEFLQFSPSEELAEVNATILRNLEQMMRA